MPGPEARDVIEHGDEAFVRNLQRKQSNIRNTNSPQSTHYLTLAVTVQLEVDISIERRNVGNSLQPPVFLAQAVDGDDSVSNLEI